MMAVIKANGKSVWGRLSKAEKDALAHYMNTETNKMIKESTDKAWTDLEQFLIQSMKNNHISKERTEKIINETNDMVDRKHNIKVVPDAVMDQYIVLNKDEFRDLLEYAIINCQSCKGIENCKLYCMQHNQKAPVLNECEECKFSFVGRKR